MRAQNFTGVIAMTIFSALAISAPPAAQAQGARPQHKEHHRYKLIDLGTFGGPESNVNLGVNAGPIISRRGTTVGTSATSVPTSPQSNSFLVCGGLDGILPFVFHAFRWHDGFVTDLGSLSPSADNCSVAQGVNARGEISGQAEDGAIDPVTGFNEVRAVRWKGGKIEELGTFGGSNSVGNQINERGQIVGAALNTIPDPFSFLYQFFSNSNGTQTRAFLWEDGDMQDLGTLGGPDAWAIYVNDRGQVAGFSYTNSTNASGFPAQDPFLWTKEHGMIDLGGFGGTSGGPTGLNNRGQVIGSSNLAGDQTSDPFLWDDGKLIDLFTQSGGVIVAANAINDAGEIVGRGVFSSQFSHAYLWRNGTTTDLGTVDGDGCSQAFAINSRGQVVGQSFACDGSIVHTFLWEDGSMIDLNTFVPPGSGLQLQDVQAINDHGEIAGDLVPPSCTSGQDGQCGHAFVLVPCEGEHSDDEGCREDDAENGATDVHNNHISVPSAAAPTGTGLSSRDIAARMRTRFSRNRAFGAWHQR